MSGWSLGLLRAVDGGVMTGAVIYMQDFVLDLLYAMDTMAFQAAVSTFVH